MADAKVLHKAEAGVSNPLAFAGEEGPEGTVTNLKRLVAGVCNAPNVLVMPFRLKLTNPAAESPHAAMLF
jgi:hypothetical protein